MIQVGTKVKVTDKTSIVFGVCIKVLGPSSKRAAFLGDVVLISVSLLNVKKHNFLKLRWRKKYSLGTLHRALLVRSKVNFCRIPGIFVKFDENSVALVNRRVVPLSNRVYGPVLKEFCMKWPSLGCVTRSIL